MFRSLKCLRPSALRWWTLSLILACYAPVNIAAAPTYSKEHHHTHSRVPACRRRGDGTFCSNGLTTGYVGPLDSAQQLKEALKTTAFRNEIIVFAETRIGDAAHTVARLRGGAGYAHVLPVLVELQDCKKLAHLMSPWNSEHGALSCGAYATSDSEGKPYESGFRYLKHNNGMTVWWRKWFTVARSVALGYNVMAVDSDIVVLDDWYWRVKQPPLAGFNMLSQAECETCINGGFTYVQNASPQGPVAWMLYEALHRKVRWTEDWSVLEGVSSLFAQNPLMGVGASDDQEALTDLLGNAATGQIRFGSLGKMFRGDPEAFLRLGVATEVMYTARNAINTSSPDILDKEYPVSGDLAAVVCEDFGPPWTCGTAPATQMTIRTALLKMPHSGGRWPPEHGGYPFSRTIGPFTAAYRKAFQDLGVPLPPDPEDPATEAQARATAPEKFGLLGLFHGPKNLGGWAEAPWFHSGRLGLWHTHLNPPPVQSIGHVHAGLFPGDFQKSVIMQLTGHYDWRVAARLAGGPGRMFYASYPDVGSFEAADRQGVSEVRRVVSYVPGVITAGMSKFQFMAAAQGLAQLAVVLEGVVAWPAAPCDADWVLTPEARAARQSGGGTTSTSSSSVSARTRPQQVAIPWHHLNTRFAVLPFGAHVESLQCEWTGFTAADCLMAQSHWRRTEQQDGGRGLLAVEFAALRRLREERGNASDVTRPLSDYTLRLPAGSEAPSASRTARLHVVSYSDVVRLNAEVLPPPQQQQAEGEPAIIVWVDRPVGHVQDLEGLAAATYGAWRRRCRALRYDDLPAHEKEIY